MKRTSRPKPAARPVTVLVGTRKGAFILRGDGSRRTWKISEPILLGNLVHHMVLGELVLRPLPIVVAHRVAKYAEALGVKDDFVRVARRYAQGAYGLAWMDLQRNGFVDHVREADEAPAPKKAPKLEPFQPDSILLHPAEQVSRQ